MKLRVLGISGSPRGKGNSDLLLREALKGAEAGGAETEYLALRELKLSPCVECNACYKTGVCRIQDDYQGAFAKLLEADRIIFATPVFFMGVSAQAKLLIDRCQCLWSRKYVLKQPLYDQGPRDRRAMVIAVGGSRSKQMFDCIRMTMKYFFDVLEIRSASNLFVNKVDDRGDILKHPTAMAEALRLGGELADPAKPPPTEPEEVALFWTGPKEG